MAAGSPGTMIGSRGIADRRVGVDARLPPEGPPVEIGGTPAGASGAPPPSGGAIHLVASLRVKTRLLQRSRVRLVRVRCSTLTLGPSGDLPLQPAEGAGRESSGQPGRGKAEVRGGGSLAALVRGRGRLSATRDVGSRAGSRGCGGAGVVGCSSSSSDCTRVDGGGGSGGVGGGVGKGSDRGGIDGDRSVSVVGTRAQVGRLVHNSSRSFKAKSGSAATAASSVGPDDSLRVNLSGLRVTPMPKKHPLEIDVRLPSGALLFFFFDDLPTFSAWRAALLTAARRVVDVYSFRDATLLGTGDHSRVYAVLPLAVDAFGSRRPVALKEVKKGALSVAQLVCESSSMDAYAGLRHPALVPALDMFDEPDRLVTVTPYFPGGSLDKRSAPFTGRAVVAVMRSLLQCLVYLHAQGIVHR